MLMAAKPQQTLECTIHVYIIHARILWLHFPAPPLGYGSSAEVPVGVALRVHARGPAAANEEEPYKCGTQIKA